MLAIRALRTCTKVAPQVQLLATYQVIGSNTVCKPQCSYFATAKAKAKEAEETKETTKEETIAEKEAPATPKKRYWKLAFIDLVRAPQEHADLLYDKKDVDLEGKNVVVVYDRKPKAKKHLLVLPTTLVQSYDNLSEVHIPLIEEMKKKAEETIDQIKATKEGKDLNFKIGFLRNAAMKQIHVHIISDDFDSEYLTNKRQWNSFNGINFVHPDEIISQLKEKGSVSFDTEKYEKALREPEIKCPRCGHVPESGKVPELQDHIHECTGTKPAAKTQTKQ